MNLISRSRGISLGAPGLIFIASFTNSSYAAAISTDAAYTSALKSASDPQSAVTGSIVSGVGLNNFVQDVLANAAASVNSFSAVSATIRLFEDVTETATATATFTETYQNPALLAGPVLIYDLIPVSGILISSKVPVFISTIGFIEFSESVNGAPIGSDRLTLSGGTVTDACSFMSCLYYTVSATGLRVPAQFLVNPTPSLNPGESFTLSYTITSSIGPTSRALFSDMVQALIGDPLSLDTSNQAGISFTAPTGPAGVPEPSSWSLAALGIVLSGVSRLKKRRS